MFSTQHAHGILIIPESHLCQPLADLLRNKVEVVDQVGGGAGEPSTELLTL